MAAEKLKYYICANCKHRKYNSYGDYYSCEHCYAGSNYYKDTLSDAKNFTMQMDELIKSNKRLVGDIDNGYFYIDSGLCTTIEKVIFNPPATIVYWSDNTKTVVKTQNDEIFDPEKGLAMAVMKKSFGNKGSYYNEVKKWVEPYYKEHAVYVKTDVLEISLDDNEVTQIKEDLKQLAAQIAYDRAVEALHDYAHRKRGKFE